MQDTMLGRTGLPVSRLCLGTMTFGRQCDEQSAHAILDEAYRLGIRFIDTADIYPFSGQDFDSIGRAEQIIGSWLAHHRDSVVLATKVGAPTSGSALDRGGSRRHVIAAVEQSLRRLQTDYIDLYQIHVPDRRTPLEQTLSALDDLIRAGKIRYIGCSNFPPYMLARSLGISERLGIARFESIQPRYNLLFRQPERDLLDHCAADGVAVLPYNPLAGGLLTAKYKSLAEPPADSRYAHPLAGAISRERYWHDAEFDAAHAVGRIAAEAGIESATLAIAWLLAQPAVTAPVIGVSRPEQLTAATNALTTVLDKDVLHELDTATAQFRQGDAQV